MDLKRKIATRTARVAVLGLGYVGLPLAVNFAKKGFGVLGLDRDQDRVDRVGRKESYILDIPSAELAGVVRTGRFKASTDFAHLRDQDIIIICVPTPIKRRYTPDISYIRDAVRTITKYLKKGALVVLESTTYPGTTREMIQPILEAGGRKCGRDFLLSFSPERIDPGNPSFDVTRIPKVVGGISLEAGARTAQLYRTIIKNIHVVSTAEAAEMTKLLENSFRIINIGWINEVAMMCHHLGIDVWEVIEAAKTKPFGFMPFYPGLGVGGHCIPEDPLYLYWKARRHGFNSKYIKLSADTNANMPAYAVKRMAAILKKRRKTLRQAKVLVLGVTYKKDVKDLRKSPALKLIELLQSSARRVDFYDPIIPFLKINGIDMKGIAFRKQDIHGYDLVVIATDHTKVDYRLLLRSARCIFDVRNVYKDDCNPKVVKL